MEFSPELLGLCGGAFTNMGLVPQVLQAYRTRSVNDLSLHFILLTMAGITLWLAYGLSKDLASVILWNSLTLFMLTALVIAKLRFRQRPEPEQQEVSPFPVTGEVNS